MLSSLTDREYVKALVAEFVGTAIFQLFAGTIPVSLLNDQPVYKDPATAATLAVANGVIYTVLGHLNPVVTIALTSSGHLNLVKGVFFVLVQVIGGICGALLSHFSLSGGSYCFDKEATGTGDVWELFAWEILMTWVFIMVFYSAVLAPGHGELGPLVIGLALTGCLWAGMAHSGGVMNPVRIISPSVANINSDRQCQVDVFWYSLSSSDRIISRRYYILAEAGGAVLAALCALILHGPGPNYRPVYRQSDQLLEQDMP